MQFQILSKHPEETSKFYTEMFGWRVNADNPLGYREATLGRPKESKAASGLRHGNPRTLSNSSSPQMT